MLPLMAPNGETTVELSDYLAVLRRHKWLIVFAALLGTGAGLAYTLTRSPVYTSTAKVLVSPRNETAPVETAVSMATEEEIVVSHEVATLAAEELDTTQEPDALIERVEVTSPAESLVLYISFTAATPEAAEEGAQAFADSYLEFRESRRNINAEIIAPANLPTSPSSPRVVLETGVAGFLGLFVGIVIAFTRNRTDRRIRSLADVESLFGAPVLTILPTAPRSGKGTRTLAAESPDSREAAPFRTLAAAVARRVQQQDIRTLLIASVEDEDSAELTAGNLSVVLAQLGKNVLLVSGNMRAPRLHTYFGVPNERGLGEALSNGIAPTDAVRATRVQGLSLLPAGPADPMAMLRGKAVSSVLAELTTAADLVVLDSPPLRAYPDGLSLAQIVDAMVLIVNGTSDGRSALAQAAVDTDAVAARILGLVLVDSDLSLIEG